MLPTKPRLALEQFIDPEPGRRSLLLAWRTELFLEGRKVCIELCDLGEAVQFLSQGSRCDPRDVEICLPCAVEQFVRHCNVHPSHVYRIHILLSELFECLTLTVWDEDA